MNRVAIAAALLSLAGLANAADETLAEKPAKSRITSVGLFKNGLAVVQRTLNVDGPGVYRVEDVPEPVHGTFWVESDAKVITRLTRRAVDVPMRQARGVDLQQELAGRRVAVHLTADAATSVVGTVLEPAPAAHSPEAWSRAYPGSAYADPFGSVPAVRFPLGRMLVLDTGASLCYIDPAKVVYLEAVGGQPVKQVKQWKPVMLLSVAQAEKKNATITIGYLAKGMAWAPSYRVDLSDPGNLVLRQAAVIKNELAPIENARVYLISGFPSVQFANVTSPMSPGTAWATFFQQLNQRSFQGHAVTSNVVSQAAMNRIEHEAGVDLSAAPSGEGTDLHYQDIGPQTLDEGDSLALETGAGKAPYERLVEWIVPDTRRPQARRVYQGQEESDPDNADAGVWDVVRFRNPLGFPMTTAPAMIVSGDRFNGQRLSYWVSPGEETTLRVSKALSIRTSSNEQEVPASREAVAMGRQQFRETTVDAELRINNQRKEPVTLVVRRRFSGELVSAEQGPKHTLLEEGVASVNKRNQLVWTLTLKPGEETKLNYSYTVLAWP